MRRAARGAALPPAPFSPSPLTARDRWSWPLFGLAAAPAPTPTQAALARAVFSRGARWLGDERTMLAAGAAPAGGGGGGGAGGGGWTELAFVGRSNAGKSTLLNALLGGDARLRRRAFVPVSRAPGETRSLDFYGAGEAARPALVLVDTPGFGFSARGRAAGRAWAARVGAYLDARAAPARGAPARAADLARVVLLVDARRGLGELDRSVLAELDARAVPTLVLLTKLDLLRPGERGAVAARTAAALGGTRMAFPALAGVAAATGEGVAELGALLVQAAKLQRAGAELDAAHRLEAAAGAAAGAQKEQMATAWAAAARDAMGE